MAIPSLNFLVPTKAPEHGGAWGDGRGHVAQGKARLAGVSLAAHSPEISQVLGHVLQMKEVGYLLARGGQNFSDPLLHLLVWKGEAAHGQAVGGGLQRKQPQQPTVSLRRRLAPLGAGVIYKTPVISTKRSSMGKVPSAKQREGVAAGRGEHFGVLWLLGQHRGCSWGVWGVGPPWQCSEQLQPARASPSTTGPSPDLAAF